MRARLERLAGRRLTADGVLVITAQRHRTQERNREDALERLVELIRAGDRTPEAAPADAADPRLEEAPPRGEGEARAGEAVAGREAVG